MVRVFFLSFSHILRCAHTSVTFLPLGSRTRSDPHFVCTPHTRTHPGLHTFVLLRGPGSRFGYCALARLRCVPGSLTHMVTTFLDRDHVCLVTHFAFLSFTWLHLDHIWFLVCTHTHTRSHSLHARFTHSFCGSWILVCVWILTRTHSRTCTSFCAHAFTHTFLTHSFSFTWFTALSFFYSLDHVFVLPLTHLDSSRSLLDLASLRLDHTSLAHTPGHARITHACTVLPRLRCRYAHAFMDHTDRSPAHAYLTRLPGLQDLRMDHSPRGSHSRLRCLVFSARTSRSARLVCAFYRITLLVHSWFSSLAVCLFWICLDLRAPRAPRSLAVTGSSHAPLAHWITALARLRIVFFLCAPHAFCAVFCLLLRLWFFLRTRFITGSRLRFARALLLTSLYGSTHGIAPGSAPLVHLALVALTSCTRCGSSHTHTRFTHAGSSVALFGSRFADGSLDHSFLSFGSVCRSFCWIWISLVSTILGRSLSVCVCLVHGLSFSFTLTGSFPLHRFIWFRHRMVSSQTDLFSARFSRITRIVLVSGFWIASRISPLHAHWIVCMDPRFHVCTVTLARTRASDRLLFHARTPHSHLTHARTSRTFGSRTALPGSLCPLLSLRSRASHARLVLRFLDGS